MLGRTASMIIAAVLAAVPVLPASQAFACPITPTWGRLSSTYGWRKHPIRRGPHHHWGIDIAAPAGMPVLAAMDGVVAYAGWYGGYGITVYLLHPGGWSGLYGHLSAVAVRVGQRVRCAQIIGYTGSTGAVTGPHLHFELRYRHHPVDPVPYLVAAYRKSHALASRRK